MKVVLVNPPTSNQEYLNPGEEKGFYKYVPLGMLYIASIMEQNGYHVECIDVAVDRTREDTLVRTEADVVGFSVTTLSYHDAVRLARKIKDHDPGKIILFGGPHPTFMAEDVLSTQVVDIVVRREGDMTIQELLHCLSCNGDLSHVKGISYMKNGKLVSTPDRPFIEDLDALPFPARHLLNSEEYAHFGSILTGRGCPYHCVFCAAGPLSGHKYRVHSVERVYEEMCICHDEFGISEFSFLDDTFTALKQRVHVLCEGFREMDFPFTWKCEARANTVDKETIQLMKSSGCRLVQFGVESGSDHILRSIQKDITTDMVKRAVKISLDAGLHVVLSFIIGHPDDTVETVEQTIKFSRLLRSLNPSKVELEFMLLVPYPGTEIRERAAEWGLKILTADWRQYNYLTPVVEPRHLTRQMLQNLLFTATLGNELLRQDEGMPLFEGGDTCES
ncbi:MAG: cobalamin B12-binding domain-containing protein [Theionarchaea archaeon]|nr:cobalamin B12-binding domain-containing protein [Theionarchaea archaeon]